MKKIKKHRLAFITLAYWFLLVYIIAALVLWYWELNKQNTQMYQYRVEQLQKDAPDFDRKLELIDLAKKGKTSQYIGEGSVFLCLILLGAVFVYRATRKQFLLQQQQQNFMMAVTHELKTPIAVAQLNLETLQKRKLDEDQRQRLISTTLLEANRLNGLTNNILTAAQLDAGAYRLNTEELSFSEVVFATANEYKNRFCQRNLQTDIEEGVFVTGEYALLQMLVSNILDNAIKYSPKDSTITVLLSVANGRAVLAIKDEGVGIPAEEKKKVFDKFYRVGSEATRTAKGTGLGLYLCKRIVQEFKGTINISDNQPKGTIFTVRL